MFAKKLLKMKEQVRVEKFERVFHAIVVWIYSTYPKKKRKRHWSLWHPKQTDKVRCVQKIFSFYIKKPSFSSDFMEYVYRVCCYFYYLQPPVAKWNKTHYRCEWMKMWDDMIRPSLTFFSQFHSTRRCSFLFLKNLLQVHKKNSLLSYLCLETLRER